MNNGTVIAAETTSVVPFLTGDHTHNIISLVLPAGNWDVTGWCDFEILSNDNYPSMYAAVSLVSGAVNDNATVIIGTSLDINANGAQFKLPLNTQRISVLSDTTVYLVARFIQTGDGAQCRGQLRAVLFNSDSSIVNDTSRRDCNDCRNTPCETSEPTGCTPPSSTTPGYSIYVSDTQGCARLLQVPENQNSLLFYNATTGGVEWRTGSPTNKICLPAIQEAVFNNTTPIPTFLTMDVNGCLKRLDIDPDMTGQYMAVINADGLTWKTVKNVFPGGPGLVYKAQVNDDAFSFIGLPVTADTYLHWNGTAFEWKSVPTLSSQQVLTQYRALQINSNSANTIQGSIKSVIYADGGGQLLRKDGVSVSANITASGAGGLDSGAVSNNTWYFLWMISDGSNNATMFSLSSASPTMPTGYTYKILVGRVRYGSSTILGFNQIDNTVYLAQPQLVADLTQTNTGDNTISLSSFLPLDANTWLGYMYASNTTNADTGGVAINLRPNVASAGTFNLLYLQAAMSGTRPSRGNSTISDFPLITPQQVVLSWASSGTPTFEVQVELTGFTIPR